MRPSLAKETIFFVKRTSKLFNYPLPVEVGDDDWYGKGDTQNPTDGTQRAHKLPSGGGGGNVPVAGAGHGDDGPVQRLGERVELGLLLVLLQGVGQAGEDQHTHAHSHTQQQQFPKIGNGQVHIFEVFSLNNLSLLLEQILKVTDRLLQTG